MTETDRFNRYSSFLKKTLWTTWIIHVQHMSNHPAVQLFLPSHPRCWSGCQIAWDSQSAGPVLKKLKHLGSHAFLVLTIINYDDHVSMMHIDASLVDFDIARAVRPCSCARPAQVCLEPSWKTSPTRNTSQELHALLSHMVFVQEKKAYPMSNLACFLIIQNCCLLLHLQRLEDPTMLQHAPKSMNGPSKQKIGLKNKTNLPPSNIKHQTNLEIVK